LNGIEIHTLHRLLPPESVVNVATWRIFAAAAAAVVDDHLKFLVFFFQTRQSEQIFALPPIQFPRLTIGADDRNRITLSMRDTKLLFHQH
ncbi:hypothetical protein SDJN02_27079, partial [Cucurbita argyrosperma subsp. argyrosperma]